MDKLDFKKILPVFVIVLIDLLGLTIIIPIMPLYAATFRADPFIIGLLGGAYPAMQFIGAPFLGRLSDRYGRKPILLISQAGTCLGFVMLGLAHSLWLLFLARMIDGLSGANISTAQAVISDSTTEKTRTQGLGLIGAAFGLGFVVGPVIAFVSLAVSQNNFHVPAWIAAACALGSLALTWFWLDETLPAEKRGQGSQRPTFSLSALVKALRHPQVGWLLVLIFAQQIAFGGFEQLLSLFMLNRLGLDPAGNALVFVFVGIIVVLVQGGLIGPWSRKLGERRLIYVGLATLAIGLTLAAFTPRQPVPWYSRAQLEAQLSGQRNLPGETPPTQTVTIATPAETNKGWVGLGWLLVMLIPAAIGGGVLQPSLNSLITKRIEPAEIGGMLGLSAALLSGANAFAPVIGGALFQWNPTMPFLLGGLLIGGLWLAARQLIKPGREEQARPGLARGGAH